MNIKVKARRILSGNDYAIINLILQKILGMEVINLYYQLWSFHNQNKSYNLQNVLMAVGLENYIFIEYLNLLAEYHLVLYSNHNNNLDIELLLPPIEMEYFNNTEILQKLVNKVDKIYPIFLAEVLEPSMKVEKKITVVDELRKLIDSKGLREIFPTFIYDNKYRKFLESFALKHQLDAQSLYLYINKLKFATDRYDYRMNLVEKISYDYNSVVNQFYSQEYLLMKDDKANFFQELKYILEQDSILEDTVRNIDKLRKDYPSFREEELLIIIKYIKERIGELNFNYLRKVLQDLYYKKIDGVNNIRAYFDKMTTKNYRRINKEKLETTDLEDEEYYIKKAREYQK